MRFKINKLLPIFVFLLSFILVVPVVRVSAAKDGSYFATFKSLPLDGGEFRLYEYDNNISYVGDIDWTNSYNGFLDFRVDGSQVLEAKPNSGYRFDGWYTKNGDLLSTDNPYNTKECQNNNIVAKFEKDNAFTISLPKTLDVSQNTTTFDVKVSNNDLWNVSVTMPNKITLNDQAVKDNKPKDPIDVNVEFENGVFNKDETRVATLTHNGISSGNWKADMNVNINADNRITYKLVDGRTFNNVVKIFFNDSKNDYFGPLRQIIFTDEPMPESVGDLNLDPGGNKEEVKGLDADGDGGVVAWVDRCTSSISGNNIEYNNKNTMAPPCAINNAITTLYISTQTPGQKVVADEDCGSMFDSLAHLYDVEMLDVSNTKLMNSIFSSEYGLDGDEFYIEGLESWNTSNVTDMSFMFAFTGFPSYDYWHIGDLSSWNTSNVTDMYSMFGTAASTATNAVNCGITIMNPNTRTDHMFTSISAVQYPQSFQRIADKFIVYDNGDEETYEKAEIGANSNVYDKSMAGTNYSDGIDHVIHLSKGEYLLDLDLNGGVYDGELPTKYDSKVGLELPKPTKDGHEFLGWRKLEQSFYDTPGADFTITEKSLFKSTFNLSVNGNRGFYLDILNDNGKYEEIYRDDDGSQDVVELVIEPGEYRVGVIGTHINDFELFSLNYITSILPNTTGNITLEANWKELSKATLNVDNLIDKLSDNTYQGNDFYDTREHMDIAFEDGYELDWDDELAKIKSGDYSNIVGLDELIDETVVATYNILDVSAIRDEVWGNPSDEPYTTTLNGIVPENFIAIYFDTSIQKWNVAESVVNGNTITINFNKKPDVVNRTPFDIDYGNNSNFIEGQDIPSEYYVGRGTKLPELVMSQEGVEPFFEKYHYGWYIQGFTTDVNDSSFTIPDDVIGNIKLMAVESNRYIGSRMKFDINGGNPIEDDDLSTPDIYDQIFYTKDGLNVSDMRVPTHPDGLDFKGWFSPYPVKVTINDNDENGDIIGNGTELITKTINGSYNLESTETTKSNYLMHLVFDSTNSSYEFESITYTLNGNVVYSYNGSSDDEIIDLWLFIPSTSDYVVDVKVKEKDGALEPFKSAEMLLEEFFDINDIKPETQNYYYLARAFYGDYKESFISEDQIKTGADLEIFDEPVTYAFNSISSNEPNDGKFIIIEDMSQLSEGKFDDISISNSVTIESYMVDDVDIELDNTTIEDDNNSSNENDGNENKDLGNGNELDKPSESESPDINVDTDSDDEIIPSPSPSPDTNLPITTPTDKSEEDDLDVESDITELVDDSVVQS